MNREEMIEKAAKLYGGKDPYMFIKGAIWADDNSRLSGLSKYYIAEMKQMERQLNIAINALNKFYNINKNSKHPTYINELREVLYKFSNGNDK